MSKLIGKISGNDWSVAPEGAEYVDLRYTYDFEDNEEWCDQNLWVKSEVGYWHWDGSYCNEVNDDFHNKDRYISRERDLEGIEETTKELVKYSSLKELPVGWFVKDVDDKIYMWNGHTLCVVDPKWGVDCWSRSTVDQINGWKYPFNDDYSIVAYADRYNGEWIPVDDPKETRKKELQEQIAKLIKELEEL